MATQKSLRPGGLTTLAIINFVLGGFQALGSLISLATLNATVVVNGQSQPVSPEGAGLAVALNVLIAALLIISAIGFLKTSRWLGWFSANLYVVVFVIRTVVTFSGGIAGGDATTFSLIGFVYPLLILVFVNLVFFDVWRSRSGAELVRGQGSVRAPHVILIAGNAVRQTLRSASGVLFCFATLVIGLFITQILFLPIDLVRLQADAQNVEVEDAQVIEQLESFGVPLLGSLIGGEDMEDASALEPMQIAPETEGQRWASYLLRERPGFLSIIMMILSFFIPIVVVFSGFNQIAGDAKNRGLRYLLLRTTRRDIFFGKFLGSVVVSAFLIFVLMVAVTVYVERKLGVYPFAEVAPWALWGFIAFVIASLPFLAISISLSSMINSPFGALAAGIGVVAVYPLVVRGLAGVWEPISAAGYLVPQPLVLSFFHPDLARSLIAVAAMLGYAAVYLGAGFLYFKRRNL
jgi:ABC-type transport system involved in multi-copper enzyme maturation permease subunit